MDPLARLAPEERLLLALGRLEPSERGRADARAALSAPSFRWERALELAAYHRVHALLARNLDGAVPRDAVPDDVRERLLRMRMAVELRNERYAHAAAEPLARLSAENVPVLLLKGAALCATVFPPGSRPLNDIDLLIRPGDYARVARALEEAGFAKAPSKCGAGSAMLRATHEAGFLRAMRSETLAIDLHWRVLPPDRPSAMGSLGFDLPVEDLLALAVPVSLGRARALAPCAEHVLVHIATQIAIDGIQAHLGRIADVDALVRRGIDGDRLVGIATRARAGAATRLALSLAAMLGAAVPAAVLRQLPGRAVRALAVPALPFESLRTAARVALVPFLLGEPWRRLLYGLTLALPTAATRGMHLLRLPRSAKGLVRRWRGALLAAGCAALVLLHEAAEGALLRRLARRLRAGLWRRLPEERGVRGREATAPSVPGAGAAGR